MDIADAIALIEQAIPNPPGLWADVGAGDGTFTRALVQLGASRIYAVDRDRRALASLARWAKAEAADVVTMVADFSRPFELAGLDHPVLDGVLLANSLHFVPDQDAVLARLTSWLRPGGRAVLVEYDGRRPSRWVPYPIPIARLPALAAAAGLSEPIVTATRPSDYGGTLYVAVCRRGAGASRVAHT
jgi:SAM-dependent methyltransferase